MKNIINFPAPENYAEIVNTDSGVKALTTKSNIEELLRKLEDKGYDVSAALIELTAMCNYINQNMKSKATIKTHVEYILNELNK